MEQKLPAYPFRTPRLVFRNLGDGRFEELIDEAGPGIAAAHTSRGCAFGDFDNDGDIDVLVMNMNEPPSLLRNDVTGGGHWLKVLLVGVTSNRSAIGARVTARYGERVQAQEVIAQASFYSANDRRLHFGLGAATSRRPGNPLADRRDRDDRQRGGRINSSSFVKARASPPAEMVRLDQIRDELSPEMTQMRRMTHTSLAGPACHRDPTPLAGAAVCAACDDCG